MMTTQMAKGNREMKAWQEKTFSEVLGGAKLTTSTVANSFHGDIEAEAQLEYLMVYLPDGSASFIGLEQVTGRIGERAGSFVLRHEGRFEGSTARVSITVIPGSATGALTGLRGEGQFESQGGPAPYTFDYYFQ